MYDAFNVFDDFTMTVEEEEASIARHVRTCTKAQRDEYCKVCMEY